MIVLCAFKILGVNQQVENNTEQSTEYIVKNESDDIENITESDV